jgi:sirohydrochlorin cobaltochelatase
MRKALFNVLTVFCTLSFISPSSHAQPIPAQKGEAALVLAVFGTSVPEALMPVLEMHQKFVTTFAGMPVRLAFTSERIRAKWMTRRNDQAFRKKYPRIPDFVYSIQGPLGAIVSLQEEGYRHIAVQSTHIFAGEEYGNLKAEIEALNGIKALRDRDKPFKTLVLGRPALGEPGDKHPYAKDIDAVVKLLAVDVELAKKNSSALVYMGHGNELLSTGAYVEFEAKMQQAYPEVPIFVGNVEGFPDLTQILAKLKKMKVTKVTLAPFMVVAGDHALNDMGGNEKDSWKSVLMNNSIEVILVVRGLAELDQWTDIYVQHLRDAMFDSKSEAFLKFNKGAMISK